MKGGMTFPKLGFIPGYQPTVIVIALILFLTLLPRPLGEEDFQLFEGADKVVHFIMFGGLTGTFMYDRCRSVARSSQPLHRLCSESMWRYCSP